MKMKVTIVGIIIIGSIILLRALKNFKPSEDHREPLPNDPDAYKYQISTEKQEIHKPQKEGQTDSNEEDKKSYFHLSFLDNFLKKYNLNPETARSFFDLLTAARNEGKTYFLVGINQLLSEKLEAKNLVDFYKDLDTMKVEVGIMPAPENENSPIIYKSGLQNTLNEYDLNELADKDLKVAVIELIKRVYNAGKDQMILDYEVNFRYIDKYIQADSQEKVDREVERLKAKLAEEKTA